MLLKSDLLGVEGNQGDPIVSIERVRVRKKVRHLAMKVTLELVDCNHLVNDKDVKRRGIPSAVPDSPAKQPEHFYASFHFR